MYIPWVKTEGRSRICMNTPSCHSLHSRYDIGRFFLFFFLFFPLSVYSECAVGWCSSFLFIVFSFLSFLSFHQTCLLPGLHLL